MVTEAGALKVVDLGLATVGSLAVAPAADSEAAAATAAAATDDRTDIEAPLGGYTPTWASPDVQALRIIECSVRPMVRARDHDGWTFVAVVIEMIVGGTPGQHGNANERLTKMAKRAVPIEVVRAWTSADVQAWLASDKRLAKLAATFAERGVDGAAMLRIDKRTLKRDFGATTGAMGVFFNVITGLVWPLPLPEPLIELLRAGVNPEPERRPRSMGVVVRTLEPMLEDAGGAMPAEALAEEGPAARLDDDEVAQLHFDLGEALRDQLARYDDAEQHFTEALALDEARLGPEDATVARRRRGLPCRALRGASGAPESGLVLCGDRAYHQTTEETASHSLAAAFGVGGGARGCARQRMARNDEAAALCSRALAAQEKALGAGHTDVGDTCNVLALAHYQQARPDESGSRRLLVVVEAPDPYQSLRDAPSRQGAARGVDRAEPTRARDLRAGLRRRRGPP